MVEWDKAAYQVAAHRSSFGELVCLFIGPVSCVSFYPFKMYCVFVCKFGESFMAVIDGLVGPYAKKGAPSVKELLPKDSEELPKGTA